MIDWIAVKEAMTDDAKGAIIGSLVGGGLGAGGGILFGKNKLVGGLVGGGAGAVSGGLAGYGLGRAARKSRDERIEFIKGVAKDIIHNAPSGTYSDSHKDDMIDTVERLASQHSSNNADLKGFRSSMSAAFPVLDTRAGHLKKLLRPNKNDNTALNYAHRLIKAESGE